jgi:hypothetical protein
MLRLLDLGGRSAVYSQHARGWTVLRNSQKVAVGICFSTKDQHCYAIKQLLLLLFLLLTAIELSLGGSSPYTITDKTYKNKCT